MLEKLPQIAQSGTSPNTLCRLHPVPRLLLGLLLTLIVYG